MRAQLREPNKRPVSKQFIPHLLTPRDHFSGGRRRTCALSATMSATPSTTPAAPASSSGAAPLMVGNVIDGKAVAAQIRKELSAKVAQLKATYGKVRMAMCAVAHKGIAAAWGQLTPAMEGLQAVDTRLRHANITCRQGMHAVQGTPWTQFPLLSHHPTGARLGCGDRG